MTLASTWWTEQQKIGALLEPDIACGKL
jgi:hypothetical protein